MLRVADVERDADLLEAARMAADELLARHPELVEKHLARWLGGRQEFLKA
jgi:ATP-dependent DNA helicase RecG